MESYTIIVLIFGLLVFFLLIGLYFVNQLFQYKLKIDNSFLTVKDLLQDKGLLIDEMLEFLSANLEHERNLHKQLVQTKELLLTVKNDSEGIQTIHKLESALESFVGLENTYKKLAKNKDYLKIKAELQKNKAKLIYAMDSYDKGVINYNNYRDNKFIYLLSKLCRIPEYCCYNN